MNKKFILPIAFVIILASAVFVFAVSEIKTTKSNSLTSGNGVCEYYQKEFSTGQKDTITVNGATLNVEYLGNKDWKVNEYQGKLTGHDFFVGNQKSKLKGVRFDFSFMDQYQPAGNLGLTEQDYYPWDCQGYSQSKGLISAITIKDGWNLIPFGISLRDCYYALEGELCKDDVLVSYIYIPALNKYLTQEEIQKRQNEQQIKDYFSEDNELTVQESSQWIYVKPGAGNKKVIGHFGASSSHRTEYLRNNVFKLKSGWNFLYVDAFMVYDDTWYETSLSLNDMKGSCNIVSAYLWDNQNQQWGTIANLLSDKNILKNEGKIGGGLILKVSNDCALGYSGVTTPPPTLPQ